ncbi:iron-containing redox enzyme family protein [Sphingomonas sp. HF-S4]|uniref:Iron-containing redox enzyme family protein n=1 Tax=Sphingomonas agrestis TaxID=3080540 RepID=A0ABU3YCT6_9SPHN|nr:iron-containing redox enzyme family protein [Sphingomonas sp. HF-S4]MDV3458992.1 iron-containing redox enzyme family protein [Sphingomonas sp. HF-S4]
MATRLRDFAHDAGSQFLTDSFQRGLAHWNRERLEPGFPEAEWSRTFERDVKMQRLEGAFLEELRAEVIDEAAAAPTDVAGFIDWFEGLKARGPGQGDPLFPWLAEEADRDQLRWFFEQEAAGEAGFDDLVAMTQVKLPVRPKLELARNYWDEMGHGTAKGMHGPMLDALVETLQVDPVIENTVWESLCLANAMTAMATSRRYAWHSVGALGVVELTAPGRSAMVAEGLKRVGLSPKEARYFTLHAVLDIKHSEDWNREAIRPAVEEDPRRATAMAEGALIRLKCGERCFEAYRARLWG